MKNKISSLKKSAALSSIHICEMALSLGAKEAKIIRTDSIKTAEWVRWKCQFGCDGFGSSRMCPPYTPTPDAMQAMLDEYKKAILFESPRGITKKIAAALERELFLAGYYKAFGLGGGPCLLCKQCNFDKGCRHTARARPSMEACGIDVYATMRGNGFSIEVVTSHKDTQHYFGMVLLE